LLVVIYNYANNDAGTRERQETDVAGKLVAQGYYTVRLQTLQASA